jgi:hypothetical protein
VPELAGFQQGFVAALKTDVGPLASQLGFAVYRNTSVRAAIEALRANYPVTEQLMGTHAFDTLALAFVQQYPPRSPVLADYGGAFTHSVAADALAEDYPFLPEVAQLERLWTEALFSPDAAPLASDAIATMNHDALMAMRVDLHPAARDAWFQTPAYSIWQAHRDGAPTSEAEIEWQPEGVVVTRPGHSVAVMLVGQDMIAFLDEIATWPTLGEAAAALLETSPEANLAELFSQLLVQGALCRAPTPTQKETP